MVHFHIKHNKTELVETFAFFQSHKPLILIIKRQKSPKIAEKEKVRLALEFIYRN